MRTDDADGANFAVCQYPAAISGQSGRVRRQGNVQPWPLASVFSTPDTSTQCDVIESDDVIECFYGHIDRCQEFVITTAIIFIIIRYSSICETKREVIEVERNTVEVSYDVIEVHHDIIRFNELVVDFSRRRDSLEIRRGDDEFTDVIVYSCDVIIYSCDIIVYTRDVIVD